MSAIPVWLATGPVRGDRDGALILTRDQSAVDGFALVRHAAAAAAAQSGLCQCCRVPSALGAVLRQLFLDRIHGTVDFATVVIAASDEAPVVEAMADALVGARYAYKGRI